MTTNTAKLLDGPTTQIVRSHMTRVLDTAQFLGRILGPICDDTVALVRELEKQADQLAADLHDQAQEIDELRCRLEEAGLS